MSAGLATIGVAFAAFCVWLTVRIVNRRERWAKRMAIGLVVVFVGYPLSFGPSCWWSATVDGPTINGVRPRKVSSFYRPIGWVILGGPKPIADCIRRYATLYAPYVLIPAEWDGSGDIAVAIRIKF